MLLLNKQLKIKDGHIPKHLVSRLLKELYGLNWFQISNIFPRFGLNNEGWCFFDRSKVMALISYVEGSLVVGYNLKKYLYMFFQKRANVISMSYKRKVCDLPCRGQRTKTNCKTVKRRINQKSFVFQEKEVKSELVSKFIFRVEAARKLPKNQK